MRRLRRFSNRWHTRGMSERKSTQRVRESAVVCPDLCSQTFGHWTAVSFRPPAPFENLDVGPMRPSEAQCVCEQKLIQKFLCFRLERV